MDKSHLDSVHPDMVQEKESTQLMKAIVLLFSLNICIYSYFPQYVEPNDADHNNKSLKRQKEWIRRTKELEDIKERHRLKIETHKEKLRLQKEKQNATNKNSAVRT